MHQASGYGRILGARSIPARSSGSQQVPGRLYRWSVAQGLETRIMTIHNECRERKDVPMIVAAADPNDDPMTRATRQMAVAAGGEPVVQYKPGEIDFSGHKQVIYLGHG